jgi:4'-phosphopantetheinyl transferase
LRRRNAQPEKEFHFIHGWFSLAAMIPTHPLTYSPITLATSLPGAHIWLLDFTHLEGLPQASYQQLLSEDELLRADTYRRGQREFIACRALVRLCLAGYTGEDPRALRFVKNSSGKPCLTGSHTEWGFNLSHTDSCAALAVIKGADIGLDIEHPRKRNFLAIARQYFHPEEFTYLSALPEHQLAAAFLKLWTLKEAFFKALGGGIATGLHRAQFYSEQASETNIPGHSFSADLLERERDWQFYHTQQQLPQPTWISLAYRAAAAPLYWFNARDLFDVLADA